VPGFKYSIFFAFFQDYRIVESARIKYNNARKKTMNSRERWQYLFSISLITLGTAARCAPGPEFNTTPTPTKTPRPLITTSTPTLTPVLTPPEKPIIDYPKAVQEHYPEIIGLLPVVGQLKSQDQKLEIITFSEGVFFDYTAILQVLRLCQAVNPETEFEARISGQPVFFHVRQRPEGGIIFVIPPSAPLPTQLKDVPARASSAVNLIPNQVLISALRTPADPENYPPHSLLGGSSELFSLELIKSICHASLAIDSDNKENDPLLQLFFCDSIAQVIALKQVGFSYGEYHAYLEKDAKGKGPPLLAFDEGSYQAIPSIGRLATLSHDPRFY
jgi:hypothetical protein